MRNAAFVNVAANKVSINRVIRYTVQFKMFMTINTTLNVKSVAFGS